MTAWFRTIISALLAGTLAGAGVLLASIKPDQVPIVSEYSGWVAGLTAFISAANDFKSRITEWPSP